MHITNQKPVVLVTGSSRGIGRAIALQFAKNHYHVILNCSTSLEQLENVKKEILALPDGSCTCCRCDVSDSSQVTAMFEEISATCGQIDVLINNAGISHIGLFTDMTDDLWNRIIQTNLSSVFYCSRATLPSMISRKKGKIINISSMWGTVGASCEVAYSAAKSGIHGLTRALAKELAPSNIQVNTIACGAIETLAEAGAIITHPGCGLCCGRTGGILSDGERVIATNNRNFLGRMGTSKVEIYLASPRTAAACAVAGAIVGPEEFA